MLCKSKCYIHRQLGKDRLTWLLEWLQPWIEELAFKDLCLFSVAGWFQNRRHCDVVIFVFYLVSKLGTVSHYHKWGICPIGPTIILMIVAQKNVQHCNCLQNQTKLGSAVLENCDTIGKEWARSHSIACFGKSSTQNRPRHRSTRPEK